jgi:CDP-glucose 4,6-dehydratase
MNQTTNYQLSTSTFFQGKKVLITGHTGFKGSWLTLWLLKLGAQVIGIALPPNTEPSLFHLLGFHQPSTINHQPTTHYCDLRDASALASIVKAAEPEIVFHLAAQPLVRASYRDPLATFSTNIMGTANLLDALRNVSSVRSVVVVTTDKVYRNLEHPYPYREDDHLGGHDPYSASKACTELITACYRASFFNHQPSTALATVRAGNVIGGGDWAEDRLIPDAIRAWQSNRPLDIRRPEAIRPWQHVLEPLAGYLTLAAKMWETPGLANAYNFGPETSEAATVREVIDLARIAYGCGDVVWGDGSQGPHEAGWLALEIAKARNELGVVPRWKLAESVERTLHWYRRLEAGADARDLCLEDINAYENAL